MFARIIFLLVVPAALLAQSADVAVTGFTLRIAPDFERSELAGEMQASFRCLRDSVTSIRFRIDAPFSFLGVSDTSGRKLRRSLVDLPGESVEMETILPAPVRKEDTVVLRIAYEGAVDTSADASVYLNPFGFLLAPHDTLSWYPIPEAGSDSTVPFLMTITVPRGMTVVGNGTEDSATATEGTVRWDFSGKVQQGELGRLLLAGSTSFTLHEAASSDSTARILLFTEPERLNETFADTLVRFLRDAADEFTGLTHVHPPYPALRFAVTGGEDAPSPILRSGDLAIGRNAISWSVPDTLPFTLSSRNPWLRSLAGLYRIPAPDSSYWFEEGLERYLASRFVMTAGGTAAEEAEREDLLINTVDFTAMPPVADLRRNDSPKFSVLKTKSAWIFSMLEYIMGRDAFDEALRETYVRFATAGFNAGEFQRICEESYGSPLDWFFREWVHGTGYPELVLSTETVRTNRGSWILRARIMQRGEVFVTPIDLAIGGDNVAVTKRIFVQKQDQTFEFILAWKPERAELDPGYHILRWVPRFRLLAHLRTAARYREFDHDLPNSEREAQTTLQFDPNNLAGWNSMAYFALGKAAVIKADLSKAEEDFRIASTLEAARPVQLYPVMSLVRLGNVLEMEGRRPEALQLYRLAETAAGRDPALFAPALIEARRYLREPFSSSDSLWFGEH